MCGKRVETRLFIFVILSLKLFNSRNLFQEIPYVMMHYEKNLTGNDRFYGFCVDILDRIAREVGFDYILDLVPDRKYGAKDPVTGEWNGMVAQLMKHVR